MKITVLACLPVVLACSSPPGLTGTWTVDSSMMVVNGVDTSLSGPDHYGTSHWIFSEDGTYEVKNNHSQLGTYIHSGDEIEISINEPHMSGWNYTILRLDHEQLHLKTELMSTDYNYEMWVYLSKIND